MPMHVASLTIPPKVHWHAQKAVGTFEPIYAVMRFRNRTAPFGFGIA